jgi:photosystem II stability/assembly factor-like uncharacterized protein
MRLLLFSALAICVLFIVRPSGIAATGIYALDTAARTVKDPSGNVVIDIARVGDRLVAVGEHGVIVYSDDNGKSWRQAKVPVDLTLTSIAFADGSHGWAAGHYGVVLHTSDSGLTWQEQLNGLQVNQLTLEAAQTAVANNDPSVGTPRAVARANHFIADGPDKPFLSILVYDRNKALVFGAYRMTVLTTNGGKDWQDWSLHVGDPFSQNLYDVARAGTRIYVVGEAGTVFESTDGGSKFVAMVPPSDATMLKVLPAGLNSVFVCGVAGQAFHSEDGGRSWQPVTFDTSANLTAGITLTSGAMLVGSESGHLYISKDQGASFRELPTVLPMAIYGMIQAANRNVVAVGNVGISLIPATALQD